MSKRLSIRAKATLRRIKLERRLRALGFEDPSKEQRKAFLQKNIALFGWPKK